MYTQQQLEDYCAKCFIEGVHWGLNINPKIGDKINYKRKIKEIIKKPL